MDMAEHIFGPSTYVVKSWLAFTTNGAKMPTGGICGSQSRITAAVGVCEAM